jgi:hypothetical protein
MEDHSMRRNVVMSKGVIVFLGACLVGCGTGVTGEDNGGSGGGGEALLAWDAPSTNADDSPLADLQGYRVYIGTSSAAYGAPIEVGNVTEHRVENLESGGTYYFAVTAYDASGNESVFSNEVFKDVE